MRTEGPSLPLEQGLIPPCLQAGQAHPAIVPSPVLLWYHFNSFFSTVRDVTVSTPKLPEAMAQDMLFKTGPYQNTPMGKLLRTPPPPLHGLASPLNPAPHDPHLGGLRLLPRAGLWSGVHAITCFSSLLGISARRVQTKYFVSPLQRWHA